MEACFILIRFQEEYSRNPTHSPEYFGPDRDIKNTAHSNTLYPYNSTSQHFRYKINLFKYLFNFTWFSSRSKRQVWGLPRVTMQPGMFPPGPSPDQGIPGVWRLNWGDGIFRLIFLSQF